MIEIGSTLRGLDRAVDVNDASSEAVLIVGQNPSEKETSKNLTFDRLNEWTSRLGISEVAFMNACSKTGSVKKSDIDLYNLAKAVYKIPRVIALGNFASEALEKLGITHFKLPHPSPLNRQINDQNYIDNCLEQCREFLSENTK